MALQEAAGDAGGGLHDRVGGGFPRYSVDARWRVPHFEKMLYDNALLAPAYLRAWQITAASPRCCGTSAARRSTGRSLEMQGPQGGFYSLARRRLRGRGGPLLHLDGCGPAGDARRARRGGGDRLARGAGERGNFSSWRGRSRGLNVLSEGSTRGAPSTADPRGAARAAAAASR